jgi:hypothetical protein
MHSHRISAKSPAEDFCVRIVRITPLWLNSGLYRQITHVFDHKRVILVELDNMSGCLRLMQSKEIGALNPRNEQLFKIGHGFNVSRLKVTAVIPVPEVDEGHNLSHKNLHLVSVSSSH